VRVHSARGGSDQDPRAASAQSPAGPAVQRAELRRGGAVAGGDRLRGGRRGDLRGRVASRALSLHLRRGRAGDAAAPAPARRHGRGRRERGAPGRPALGAGAAPRIEVEAGRARSPVRRGAHALPRRRRASRRRWGGMKYYLPDSQDLVDLSFDFTTERRGVGRVRDRDDRYAHEVFSGRAFDGMLVSKAIVDGTGGAGQARYTRVQRERLAHEGVHRSFRAVAHRWGPISFMGDCGPSVTSSKRSHHIRWTR
jgi:hypothetical protein